jgi:hypothetical protein
MTQPQQHPEELLAEYVDGTLGPEDRARVESHLSTCGSCREEVALAGPARAALSGLPELDVPAGTTWPVVQRARQRKRWLPALSPRVAWATAGAAAVLIVASVLIGGQIVPSSRDLAAPEGQAELRAPEEAEDAGLSPAGPDTAKAPLLYPTFRRSARDYGGTALASLADELTDEARQALELGFPEPPARFYTRTAFLTNVAGTRQALSCIVKAVSPDRSLAPFAVVAARFEEEPAYIGAFLQADRPDRPYAEVVLYVVSRDGCALRSFARQQL